MSQPTQQHRPTPLILIHGFRGTHHGLAKIVESLDASYTPYVPDLPGFGEGDVLESYTLDAYVEWLHRFIKDLALEQPPILLGHSFGSIITAAYAARYPSTIKQLILVNPIGAPALEGPKKVLTKLAVFYYWIGSALPAKSARIWLSAKPMVFIMSTTMTKTHDAELRQWIHNEHYAHFSDFHSAKSVLEAFRTSVEYSVRDTASAISVPTLLVVGDKDDITPLKKQYEVAQLFPQATLEVLKGVGHLTHYETPHQVATAIQTFTRSA